MLLTIDLGNTNLALGLFKDDKLSAHWRLATDHHRMPDEYGLQFHSLLETCGCLEEQLEGIVLSSVVPPLTERVQQACNDYMHLTPLDVSPT